MKSYFFEKNRIFFGKNEIYMFSKIDIQKSLGKDIIFFPFKEGNIKENSLNLTVSKLAWTLTDISQNTKQRVEASQQQIFKNPKSCYSSKDGKDYIILHPLSTTIVITEEFLAIGKSIGGTIHTRVGTATLGVGHISTMLGPSYMGKLCVPLHNPTCETIYLEVGTPFLSIVFYHLKTNIKKVTILVKAHIDKFARWGIKLTDEELEKINVEDLKDIRSCADRMEAQESFKVYRQKYSWKKRFLSTVKDWCSPRNIIILLLFIVAILLLITSFFLNKESPIGTWAMKSQETLMTIVLLLGIQLIPNEK